MNDFYRRKKESWQLRNVFRFFSEINMLVQFPCQPFTTKNEDIKQVLLFSGLTVPEHWVYNYLYNQCLSPLMLWVRIPLMARCTRYNIMC